MSFQSSIKFQAVYNFRFMSTFKLKVYTFVFSNNFYCVRWLWALRLGSYSVCYNVHNSFGFENDEIKNEPTKCCCQTNTHTRATLYKCLDLCISEIHHLVASSFKWHESIRMIIAYIIKFNSRCAQCRINDRSSGMKRAFVLLLLLPSFLVFFFFCLCSNFRRMEMELYWSIVVVLKCRRKTIKNGSKRVIILSMRSKWWKTILGVVWFEIEKAIVL